MPSLLVYIVRSLAFRQIVLSLGFITLLPLVASAQNIPQGAATYSQQQFNRGKGLYASYCQECHGDELQGGSASSLSDESFRESWNKPAVSLDDLHYIITSNMPPEQPGVLDERQYLDIFAVILGYNGVAAGASELQSNSNYLSAITLQEAGTYFDEQPSFIAGENRISPLGLGPSDQQLKQAAQNATNWLYHTRDYAGTRFSPLQQIEGGNVSTLQPVCLNQLGGTDYFQSGPLVFEGMMILTLGARTVAVQADTCREIWSHSWEYQDQSVETTNRGVAIKDGYVIRGTSDGYLLALDSLDGQLLWARQVANPAEGEQFTMAPMIFEDTILIGPAGGNYGISGWIGAFSLYDGSERWRFHTVPGATQEDNESWGNPLGIKIGGGAIWTPLSLDAESSTLYVAVTNPAPDFPSALRPGENLYTNSVLSLDVNSGNLNWYKQLIPGDDHGWDLTQVSPLYQTEINGILRNLIGSVGKDGLLRVLDRDDQRQIFETAVTTQLNVNAPVAITGTYTCPGVSGGVLWNGPALAIEEELLITPAVNLCSTFYRARETRYIEGRDYFGGTVVSDPETLAGFVTAVDMRSGDVRWQHETALPMVAAVTTTAGGLVLTGELGGDFLVLDASSGEALYRFNTGGAIGGGIITYAVEGRQFIAVVSGRPSRYQVNGDMGSPTLLVFALPDNN